MKILIYLIVAVILFLIYVRYLESTSIFFPNRVILATPQDAGIAYEDVTLTAQDGILLHGWLMKHPGAVSTILLLHGNASNVSDCLETVLYYYKIGLNVFIVDYRGYGNSQGKPSEEGMYRDTLAAYDYLLARNDIDSKKIIVYGGSLGGAAAIDLATKRDVPFLIIDSAFSSARDMAKIMYPYIPGFLISTKMDSLAKIKHVKGAKLFMHSLDDEMIPYHLGKKLFDAALEPKTMITVNGGHNDLRFNADPGKVKDAIIRFLTENHLL
jgi:fermentation-respiration switch protein FrsA (DUF1100 family)